MELWNPGKEAFFPENIIDFLGFQALQGVSPNRRYFSQKMANNHNKIFLFFESSFFLKMIKLKVTTTLMN